MNFCDKLQKIRKENNITQEQLADKLNVSRQAVSKWESGTAYPDTEKLIQISKLFKVSLDDLINDKGDTAKTNDKKKFNFMETFNMIFESISKVWTMFWSMKFWEKIKFLLEMAFVILAIYLAASLINSVILGVLRRIFAFLPYKVYNVIDYFVYTVLYIVWLVIGVMFFIKVLKVRYLDYYVIVKDDSVDKPTVEEPIKELKEKKETKIVIRDPEHSAYNVFGKIAKFFVFLFKCLCVILMIPVVICFIALASLLVVSLVFLFSGLFFNGITLGILGVLAFTYLLIRFMYNIIFNQKINYKTMFLVFIISISLMGIGIGVSFASLDSFKTTDEVIWEKVSTQVTVPMDNDLVVSDEIADLDKSKIIIDNNLKDIKMDITTYECVTPYADIHNFYYGDRNYEEGKLLPTLFIYTDDDEFRIFKQVVKDLKHQKLNTYDINYGDYEIDKLYISEANLNKIKDNTKKIIIDK
ncbi:MAG: helix-turn-helix domain-containing protein [Bacilli bacterium]|nr:helix-turn-helix domain-containing protein [Bacilli bacterium]